MFVVLLCLMPQCPGTHMFFFIILQFYMLSDASQLHVHTFVTGIVHVQLLNVELRIVQTKKSGGIKAPKIKTADVDRSYVQRATTEQFIGNYKKKAPK